MQRRPQRRLSDAVIVSDPGDFHTALAALPADAPVLPRSVFLVAPERFHVSTETAHDNPYLDTVQPADPQRAQAQFDELLRLIRSSGVAVTCFPGDPDAPDGVFPNNVFATVPGRLIVGRMLYPGRQAEARRKDIRAYFRTADYEVVDLSRQDGVAELTGPLVLDRARRVGYCGMSERVDEAGLAAMHEAFDLRLTFRFDLDPREYHTNVVLSVLAARACVLYPGAFRNPAVAEAIAAAWPGRCLMLDEAEKNAFAANCIALTDKDLFMSQAARDALAPAKLKRLAEWGFEVHSVALDEIEKAGGSLRCMVAEIF
ncbi:MAG: arginine deiminase-related protein [Xanthomonadales bacterium]|nr:arginine deiminase-related protein [Xanthomonadales bacterium]